MSQSLHHSFRHFDGTIDMRSAIQAGHDAKAVALRKSAAFGAGIFRACMGRSRALPGFPIVALALIIGAASYLSACSTTGPSISTKSPEHPMSAFSVRGDF